MLGGQNHAYKVAKFKIAVSSAWISTCSAKFNWREILCRNSSLTLIGEPTGAADAVVYLKPEDTRILSGWWILNALKTTRPLFSLTPLASVHYWMVVTYLAKTATSQDSAKSGQAAHVQYFLRLPITHYMMCSSESTKLQPEWCALNHSDTPDRFLLQGEASGPIGSVLASPTSKQSFQSATLRSPPLKEKHLTQGACALSHPFSAS